MSSEINISELYRAFGGMVYTLSLSYLQNKEDAEEVTQDVFVKVHLKSGQFKKESTVKTWIYRITINECLDFIKAKKRRKRSTSTNTSELTESSKVEFNHPGILLEQKEQASYLLECLNQLTHEQKTAFLLSKMDGLKQEEIGKIMDKSISGVESLVFRAKLQLRKIISTDSRFQHKNSSEKSSN